MRIAFAGFRHDHIRSLYERVSTRDDLEVAGASEAHIPTREVLGRAGTVRLTHADYRELIAETDCDAVAVGDYYGRRGEVILAALAAGKHVVADKPICTRQDERDRIAAMATEKGLRVGCMLDCRDAAPFRTLRRLIGKGTIGEVHTVAFAGQHPLLYGSRPDWYFEPGKHGGTINDIAIHAFDLVPWMTGRRFAEIVAARAWNARFDEVPHFQDAAQMMLRLDNDGGVLGDVSYLAPDQGGYATPQYWRVSCHGPGGVLEVAAAEDTIYRGGGPDGPHERLPLDAAEPGGYLNAFLRDVAEDSLPGDLTTADVLEAARISLAVQEAADNGRVQVPL